MIDTEASNGRSIGLHILVLLGLSTLYFVLPEYHSNNLARIMLLSIYAMGYNLLFGYTGLLSLGHALFFATGMYGFGLAMHIGQIGPVPAHLIGVICSLLISAVIAMLALRTSGVAFMIVTLMFAQAGYLAILLAGDFTRGDEGFNIRHTDRIIAGFDPIDPAVRYYLSFTLFAVCFLFIFALIKSRFGRTLIAIRENEERTRMLGYNIHKYKLIAIVISGTLSGLAGASYALLDGYIGATFATVQYSILPLVWVLLGGAGTTIGPLIGTVFMFYLIDLSSEYTSAYMLIAGLALIMLTLFAPQGLAGLLKKRLIPWLP